MGTIASHCSPQLVCTPLAAWRFLLDLGLGPASGNAHPVVLHGRGRGEGRGRRPAASRLRCPFLQPGAALLSDGFLWLFGQLTGVPLRIKPPVPNDLAEPKSLVSWGQSS